MAVLNTCIKTSIALGIQEPCYATTRLRLRRVIHAESPIQLHGISNWFSRRAASSISFVCTTIYTCHVDKFRPSITIKHQFNWLSLRLIWQPLLWSTFSSESNGIAALLVPEWLHMYRSIGNATVIWLRAICQLTRFKRLLTTSAHASQLIHVVPSLAVLVVISSNVC